MSETIQQLVSKADRMFESTEEIPLQTSCGGLGRVVEVMPLPQCPMKNLTTKRELPVVEKRLLLFDGRCWDGKLFEEGGQLFCCGFVPSP